MSYANGDELGATSCTTAEARFTLCLVVEQMPPTRHFSVARSAARITVGWRLTLSYTAALSTTVASLFRSPEGASFDNAKHMRWRLR
jgi:hypothetical protein